MNIKKALLVALSTGLIATSLVNTNYVNAEGTDEGLEETPEGNENNESKGTSEATVKFTIDSRIPELLNPNEPNKTINPEQTQNPENVTKNYGPLSLDYVEDIDFGSQVVNLEGGKYEAKTKTPYIQVTDERGPGGGWHVTAKAEHFTNTDIEGNPKSLYGASIIFKNGLPFTKDTNPTILAKKNVNQNIKLMTGENPDSDYIVSTDGGTIEKPEGLYSWIISWVDKDFNLEENKNENVILDIPEVSASKGNHASTITWTLTDGPYDNQNETENE